MDIDFFNEYIKMSSHAGSMPLSKFLQEYSNYTDEEKSQRFEKSLAKYDGRQQTELWRFSTISQLAHNRNGILIAQADYKAGRGLEEPWSRIARDPEHSQNFLELLYMRSDILTSRLQKVYDNLKNRGYIYDTPAAAIESMGDGKGVNALLFNLPPILLPMYANSTVERLVESGEFPGLLNNWDKVYYYRAIEMMWGIFDPDVLSNAKLVTIKAIKEHPELFQYFAVSFYYADAVGDKYTNEREERKSLSNIDEKNSLWTRKANVAYENALEAEIRTLEFEKSSAEEEAGALREQIAELQGRIARQTEKLDKQAEILKALKPLAGDQDVEEVTEPIEPIESETKAIEPVRPAYKDIELPETGILFVGGHDNLVPKIKERHPGWHYLDTEKWSSFNGSNDNYIVLKHDHIEHGAIAHIYNVMPNMRRNRIIYTGATNLDKIDDEIRSSIWKLKKEE